MSDDLIFYTHPMSRARIVRWMLEEVGQPYRTEILDYATTLKGAEYLAVNPMGKVPAILHDGALVTEQGAVYAYLADLYPETGITPAIGDPLRGPYLRWLFYYGSSFEPALIDKSMKREPAPPSTSPYGDYDTMLKTLTDQLAKGPFLLGERFTAADVLWGTALRWTTMFKLVTQTPVFTDHFAREIARPAFARAARIDADLLAVQNKT